MGQGCKHAWYTHISRVLCWEEEEGEDEVDRPNGAEEWEEISEEEDEVDRLDGEVEWEKISLEDSGVGSDMGKGSGKGSGMGMRNGKGRGMGSQYRCTSTACNNVIDGSYGIYCSHQCRQHSLVLEYPENSGSVVHENPWQDL